MGAAVRSLSCCSSSCSNRHGTAAQPVIQEEDAEGEEKPSSEQTLNPKQFLRNKVVTSCFEEDQPVEGLQTILKVLWPHVDKLVQNIFHETIAPAINQHMPSKMQFHFEKFSLGVEPPVVGQIKLSRTLVSNGYLIYVPLSYKSDVTLKLVSGPIKVGLTGLFIEGDMMIRLDPLMDEAPLVGGLSFYFLDPPKIDFQLTGLGAIAELGAVRSIVHSAVDDALGSIMVLPNRFGVPIAEPEQGVDPKLVKHPAPKGMLRVAAVSAKNLRVADWTGTSDPYVFVRVGQHTWRSQTVKNSLNPAWDQKEHNFFMIWSLRQKLQISLWDEDYLSCDDYLGMVPDLTVGNALTQSLRDLRLVGRAGGPKCDGSVTMACSWLEIVDGSGAALLQSRAANDRLTPCMLAICIDRISWDKVCMEDATSVQVVATLGATSEETQFVSLTHVARSRVARQTERVVERATECKLNDEDIAYIADLDVREVKRIQESKGMVKEKGRKSRSSTKLALEQHQRGEAVFDTILYMILGTGLANNDKLKLEVRGKEHGVLGSTTLELKKEHTDDVHYIRRYSVDTTGGLHVYAGLTVFALRESKFHGRVPSKC